MTEPAAPATRRGAGSSTDGSAPRSRWLVAAAVVVAVAGAGAGAMASVVALQGDPDPGTVQAIAAADPVDLATLPDDVARLYRFVESNPTDLSEIPCFCGCEDFLGHGSLHDCFVRSDGAGYDSHAAGCGVCIGEAAVTADLLAAGTPVAEVTRRIVEQFGATPGTSPEQTVPRT